MARHHPELILCGKPAGINIGKLCQKCEDRCPLCDSYVRPEKEVRICDNCSYGYYENKCIVCGNLGVANAYYCKECVQQERDRDNCPRIINMFTMKNDSLINQSKYNTD